MVYKIEPQIEKGDEQISTNNKDSREDAPETELYAIYVPRKNGLKLKGDKFVFKSTGDCFLELTKHKGATVKSFQVYADALEYTINGPAKAVLTQEEYENMLIEEECHYARPTCKMYQQLYKVIARGDLDKFNELVSRNPRYLVSDYDTPTILTGKTRNNAVHICCTHNRPEICSQLLEIVSSANIFKLLYPAESEACIKRRSNHLLDRYLNTPEDTEKNLTPLHRSIISGAVACVRVLMSYPNCSRLGVDINKNSTSELIVNCSLPSEGKRTEMEMLIRTHYYVPIFHDEEKLFTSVIAEPMSPNLPLLPSEPGQQMNGSVGYTSIPSYKLHGYAGPMTYQQAKEFCSEWRLSIIKSSETPKRTRMDATILNNNGRELAIKNKVPFKEYWGFLGKFIDINMDEGLRKLEAHLKKMESEVTTERKKQHEDSDFLGREKNNNAAGSGEDNVGCLYVNSDPPSQLPMLQIYLRSVFVYVLTCHRELRSVSSSLSV